MKASRKPPDPYRLPDQVELRLAYDLVARRSGLASEVLFALLGRPKRYSELRPLLRGRRDHNLTVALRWLEENGMLDRRTDARRRPVVDTYELTPLGIQVVLALRSIRPLEEQLDEFARARRASA